MTVKPKKGNLKRLFLFNGLLFVVALCLIQYSVVINDVPSKESPVIPDGLFSQKLNVFDEPRPFPDLAFKTAFDKDIMLDDVKGEWIVLNFWATWCPPCLVEMPSLQKLQDSMGNLGIKVVAVSLDRNMDGKRLRDFMAKHQFGPIAAYYGDYPSISRQVQIRGLPTTYILAPNGQAVASYEGDADWSGEEAKAFIASLLSRAQP